MNFLLNNQKPKQLSTTTVLTLQEYIERKQRNRFSKCFGVFVFPMFSMLKVLMLATILIFAIAGLMLIIYSAISWCVDDCDGDGFLAYFIALSLFCCY